MVRCFVGPVGRHAVAFTLAAGLMAAAGDSAGSEDRHVGYYYPAPESSEVYQARLEPLPDSDRQRRVGFVTVLTNSMLENPYPPPFAIFAKGADAEKLIITALYGDGYNTLFRARALFAMLTAMARVTPFFADQPAVDRYTFFDLATLLGFSQITYTNGERFAHQVTLR